MNRCWFGLILAASETNFHGLLLPPVIGVIRPSLCLSLFDQTSHNDEIHFAKTNQSCRRYGFTVIPCIFIFHRRQCLMFTSLWTEGLIKPSYWTFCTTASFSESLRIDSWPRVHKRWIKLPLVLPHKIRSKLNRPRPLLSHLLIQKY